MNPKVQNDQTLLKAAVIQFIKTVNLQRTPKNFVSTAIHKFLWSF